MIGILIPTNVFVYATSDTSYVESVSSTVNIASTQYNKTEGQNNNTEDVIVTDIAKVLGMDISEEETYVLVFGEELANFDVVYKSKDTEDELNEKFKDLHEITSADLGDSNIIEIEEPEKVDESTEELETEQELEEQAEEQAEEQPKEEQKEQEIKEEQPKVETVITMVDQSGALLNIDNPREDYTGAIVTLSPEDRYILEHLVMGEAGGEGYEGAALVAQTIRDTMVYKNFTSVEDVRKACKYSGSLSSEPNQDVLNAVSYIFDNGGYAVQHELFYFYAPKWCDSSWHESQNFVIEYGGHRFFSNN